MSGLARVLMRLPAFRHAVSGHSTVGIVQGQAFALAMTAIALTGRFILDSLLPPGFPYLTFFPAGVITGFVWGILASITCAALSGLAAWYLFVPPFASFSVDTQSVTALIFYLVVIAIDLGLLQLALFTLGSQVRSQPALTSALQLQQTVSEEVDHRLRNLLATVNGLISFSQKHASTSDVSANGIVPLNLIIHELGTNCLKYGSLPF